MKKLCDELPEGNMVECRVQNSEGLEDVALWGCSGFMGEPLSFFEPQNLKFKAKEIVKWKYC